MTTRARSTTVLTSLLVTVWCAPLDAGPRVGLVLPPDAPRLEQFAASELTAYLERLFEAVVQTGPEKPDNAAFVILLGRPETNPAVRTAVGDNWPALSDQGFVLRSASKGSPQVLVVGGGSPVATLWAAYELAHRFGVRFLLSGDVYPPVPRPLELNQIDVISEPSLRTRTWRTVNDFAIGPEAWGIDEQRRVLRQLAKLRFNRILLTVYPWQPFVDYAFAGVRKQTAMLWYGYRYPVDGDTAAKSVFRGAREFTNPDFAGKTTYQEMTQAGITLARGIIDEAQRLGMSAAIAISPLEFPKEFAQALPGAKVLQSLERLVIGPGSQQPPDDPVLRELVATKIRAYLETYPTLDALYLTLPEFPDWVEHSDGAWKRMAARTGIDSGASIEGLVATARERALIASGDRGEQALRGNITALDFLGSLLSDPALLGRSEDAPVKPVIIAIDPALFSRLDKIVPAGAGLLHFVDYTARRVVENVALLGSVPSAAANKSALILTLADDNVGILPQMTTGHIHRLTDALRRHGWEGFSTRYWMIGDLEPVVYFLSRSAFDATMTPERAFDELITATCGDGVAERLILAFGAIERATDVIDGNNIGFAFPVPQMVMKHYTTAGPPPDWWREVRDLYTEAMIELYRAHGRVHRRADGGRAFIRYLAKRCEFAIAYLTAIETLRHAAVAREKKDTETLLTHLETAVESMYDGINALGEVVRGSSDRGLIAVLNAYGYRPIRDELEAQAAAPEAQR